MLSMPQYTYTEDCGGREVKLHALLRAPVFCVKCVNFFYGLVCR